jgi:ribosomal protein S18 acetylase RimI-like enzyme
MIYRNLDITFLDQVEALESTSYPADEAATREKLELRLREAPELFLGAFLDTDGKEELVGYVCSTKTTEPTLTHESMGKHEKEGKTVCIHSVVVNSKFRRSGIGLKMMKEYLKRVKNVDQFLLLSKKYLIPFYEKAGFELLGVSPVVHGAENWYDMRYVCNSGK